VKAAVTVSRPARRRRTSAENTIQGVAIPRLDLVADLMEGLGQAAASMFPHVPIDPGQTRRAAPVRREPAGPPRAGHRLPLVLQYPTIDPEVPLGPSVANPMGEGSEETALPAVDPVDARQSQPPTRPEPQP
jgi:hypothetical protein